MPEFLLPTADCPLPTSYCLLLEPALPVPDGLETIDPRRPALGAKILVRDPAQRLPDAMPLIAGNLVEKIDQVSDRPLVTENTKKFRGGEPGLGGAIGCMGHMP